MFKVFIGVVFSSLISSQESGLSAGASTNDVLLLHLLLHLILLLLLLLPFPAAKSGRCAGDSKSARQWKSLNMYNGFRLLGMCLSLESLDNLSAGMQERTPPYKYNCLQQNYALMEVMEVV